MLCPLEGDILLTVSSLSAWETFSWAPEAPAVSAEGMVCFSLVFFAVCTLSSEWSDSGEMSLTISLSKMMSDSSFGSFGAVRLLPLLSLLFLLVFIVDTNNSLLQPVGDFLTMGTFF